MQKARCFVLRRPQRVGRQDGCIGVAAIFVFGGLSFLGWQAYYAYGRTAALAAGLIGLAVCLLVCVIWVAQFFLKSQGCYCPYCGDIEVEPVSDDKTIEQYPAAVETLEVVLCFRCKPCNRFFWRCR